MLCVHLLVHVLVTCKAKTNARIEFPVLRFLLSCDLYALCVWWQLDVTNKDVCVVVLGCRSIWLPGSNVTEHAMSPNKPEEFVFDITTGNLC